MSDFQQRLDTIYQNDGANPYLDAFDSIEKVAKSLERWLNTPETKVEVEPGFQARIGQQYNIVLKIPSKNVDDTLFRAYVTPSGRISLDLYDDDPVPCANEAEMENRLLDFLAKPEVKSRMMIYRKLVH